MSVLTPLMVGQWDGCNLWLQWLRAPVSDEGGQAFYRVRVRLRRPGTEWGRWVELLAPERKAWRVVPTMREGWEIQAQVAAAQAVDAAAESLAWEGATEATFARCTAPFEFTWLGSGQPPRIPAGGIFSAYVDRTGCSYRTEEEIHLTPNVPVAVTMVALHLSGFCQLDAAGDFDSKQVRGLRVVNTGPSENDLEPTANPAPAFTKLSKLPYPGGPGVIVPTGKRWGITQP